MKEIILLIEYYNNIKQKYMDMQDVLKITDNLLVDKNVEINELKTVLGSHINENMYIKNSLNKMKDQEDQIKTLNLLLNEKTNLLNKYNDLIEDIKTFIVDTQKSQNYIPLFNPTRVLDNLMILFQEKLIHPQKSYPSPESPIKELSSKQFFKIESNNMSHKNCIKLYNRS